MGQLTLTQLSCLPVNEVLFMSKMPRNKKKKMFLLGYKLV